jgi:hypothetical protein
MKGVIMAHEVVCRVCKKKIDIDVATDWVMPSKNWYYHVKCYNDWLKRKGERSLNIERTEDEWFELLKDYIWRDIKLPDINWTKVTSQWKNFLRQQYTPKGMYFAILYFYEVQHNNREASKGGIGIIPNIYYESAQYWSNLEQKRAGVLEDIVKQMAARINRPVLSLRNSNNRNTIKPKYSLDDIGGEDD